MATLRAAAACVCLLVLDACANHSRAPIQQKSAVKPVVPVIQRGTTKNSSRATIHRVRRGDTLHAIAWRYGLDHRNLVRWNNISNPNLIFVGQRLRLTAPSSSAVQKKNSSAKPVAGKSTPSTAAPAKTKSRSKKTPPLGKKNTPAMPLRWSWPANGKVRTAKRVSGARGIEILGKRGATIKAAAGGTVVYSGSGLRGYGELIIVKHNDTFLSAYAHSEARLVEEGRNVKPGQAIARMGDSEAREVMLHFEIRRDGKTVDPLQLLPRR